MILSVLIPTVPSRREMALALYDELIEQTQWIPVGAVEILLLLDNKMRTIGKKREALVQIAMGRYVSFVDDDDAAMPGYVSSILSVVDQDADVIVFDSLCSINGAPAARVRHGLEFQNEQYNPAGFTRTPWHIHAWRREIAQAHSFPDTSYGEDWGWVEKLLPHAKTQARASAEPLYHYSYSAAISEAA